MALTPGLSTAQLRTMVQIQQRLTGTDALGQPVQGWTTVAAVWASVRHASGMEATKADAAVSTVRASIRIRWREGVTAAMRVLAGGQAYDIQAVLPDLARREYLDLVCEAAR